MEQSQNGEKDAHRERIQKLTKYIQNIILNKPHAQFCEEEAFSEQEAEFYELQETVRYLAQCLSEANSYLRSLCEGELDSAPPSRKNFLAGSLKELHSRLNHVTWQASCVAAGDYTQHVSFFGDFSVAFNKMIEQLAEREANLRKNSEDLNGALQLLRSVMDRQKEFVLVFDTVTNELLYFNKAATDAFCNASGEFSVSTELAPLYLKISQQGKGVHTQPYKMTVADRYFDIYSAPFKWEGREALVYIIEDTTQKVHETMQLEVLAYRDSMTGVFNRRYGEELFLDLKEKKIPFSMVLVDLDHLKHVNDTYGHISGDEYILYFVFVMRKHLRDRDAICRMGGDEFLIFLPHCPAVKAEERIGGVREEFVATKRQYPMSFSYGILGIPENFSEDYETVLRAIDAKMYVFKRKYKKKLDEKS